MAAVAALYGGMAAMQLVSGYFASQNVKETAKLNREIAEMNAKFVELDAYDTEIDGLTRKARYQGIVDNVLSTQRANLAAADIDINYGSAASIPEETRFIGELNKMEIEKEAREKALGLKRQARDIRSGSVVDYARERARAGAMMFNSGMQAFGTGLQGAEKAGMFKANVNKSTGYMDDEFDRDDDSATDRESGRVMDLWR